MPIRPCRKEVTGLFAHRTENISNGTSAFLPEVDELELGIVPRLQVLSNFGYASTAASFLFAACTNLIRRRNPFSKTPQTAGGPAAGLALQVFLSGNHDKCLVGHFLPHFLGKLWYSQPFCTFE